MLTVLVKWKDLHQTGGDILCFNAVRTFLCGVLLMYSSSYALMWLFSGNLTASPKATSISRNTTDVCGHESFVDGCTIPFNITSPYKAVFRPSCIKHDVCYYCGEQHGWSRDDCDWGFFNDMLESCNVLNKNYWIQCSVSAFIYYAAVKIFASSYYEVISPGWCQEDCARGIGIPNLYACTVHGEA